MTVKDQIRQVLDELPDDATLEDALQRAERDADAGDTFSDDEARRRMAKWLK